MNRTQARQVGARRATVAVGFALAIFVSGCGSSGGSDSSSGDATTTTKASVATTADDGSTTTTTAATSSTTAPATDSVTFEETGIGPIKLGMSLDDAKATGWVGKDIGTCGEGLGGEPVAGSFGFSLDGANAPKGLDGSITVTDSKVSTIDVRGGADMANGVHVEPFGEWTPDLAIKALNLAGYEIAYDTIFEENDLAKVTSPDGNHYQLSLTSVGVDVAVPEIQVCD